MHPAQNASPDHCFHETPKQNARKTSPSEVCVKVFGTNWDQTAVWSTCKSLKTGGQGRNRTADASLFRAALYRCQSRASLSAAFVLMSALEATRRRADGRGRRRARQWEDRQGRASGMEEDRKTVNEMRSSPLQIKTVACDKSAVQRGHFCTNALDILQ